MRNDVLTHKQRNSSIELLRIVAMWMIVFYHFHVHVLSVNSDLPFFKAIQIPFHISVPLFVLISGFFGIHFSIKGFCKLITQIGFYSLLLLFVFFPLNLFFNCSHPLTGKQIFDGLCFISRTNNLWFTRTYLLLYLLSPFWNKVLQGQSVRQRLLLLFVLAFMVLYMSNVGQISGLDGKSLISFLFFYTIGHSIRDYHLSEKANVKWLLPFYVIVNLVLVLLYIVVYNNVLLRVGIWTLAFKYNSPICLLSASIVFILFTKTHLKSVLINKIATSVFAVYLISENALLNVYLNDIVKYLFESFSVPIMYFFLVLLTTSVFVICVSINNFTVGIQRMLSNGLISCFNGVTDKVKRYV